MSSRRKAKMQRRTDHHACSVKNIDENVDKVDMEQKVNSGVELTYDVLTIIFKNLNAKDLCNAAKVCRCWSEGANNEKRVRCKRPFTLLGDLNRSWNDLCPGKALIDNVSVKPILSMVFTRALFNSHPATKKDNVDCPCRILPSDCHHVTVASNGIVKDKFESENPLKAAYMLLPKDDDIAVDTIFEFLENGCHDRASRNPTFGYNRPVSKASLQKLKESFNTKNAIKCFVVFSCDTFRDTRTLSKHMPRDRTLSGCVVSGLALCKTNKDDKFCSKLVNWITLLISGRGVHTWSAVLQRKCDTKEKIERKLSKLKERVQLKKTSICFMFACEGRGERMFSESHVESTIFKELFPEVPLIGCSGGGEFGNCSIDRVKTLEHQFSTVFMIVTYGQS